MKYMVMECHLSYAVVLDEEGRFLKVANRNYEVGQRISDVIEMQIAPATSSRASSRRWLYTLTAMAACLLLVITSVFQMGQQTYASVYMSINPAVRIDVNRSDVVVGLAGTNTDGENLIIGYDFKGKHLDLVMDELVDLAIDQGYLHEGGQITLVLDAESDQWVVSHSDALTTHLAEHLNEKLTVTIEITDQVTGETPIVIPITPSESTYGESDYGESDYGAAAPTAAPEADNIPHGDSAYADGQTDYGDHAYSDDSQSDYAPPKDSGKTSSKNDDQESDYDSEKESEKDSDYGSSKKSDKDSGYGSDYDKDDD